MLTLDQCVDFCGLTDDEVDLLARHHGVPSIVAAELGCELLKTREGRAQLAYILRHCADCAIDCGNQTPVRHLADQLAYRRYGFGMALLSLKRLLLSCETGLLL